MSIKNYGSGVNVDFGSDFGPDEILRLTERLQGMNLAQQNAERNEKMQLLQENEMKYQQKITEQTHNQNMALTEFSSKGLDLKKLSSPNNDIYSIELPDAGSSWDDYVQYSKSNGINRPSMASFQKAIAGEQASYMNQIVGRFNLEYERVRRENPNESEDKIMEYMRDNYNADNVYRQYSKVQAIGGSEYLNQLKYTPPTADDPWYVDWGFVDKDIDDSELSMSGKGVTGGILGTAGGAYTAKKALDSWSNFRGLKKEDLDKIAKLKKDLAYEKELVKLGKEPINKGAKLKGTKGKNILGTKTLNKKIQELEKSLAEKYPKSEAAKKYLDEAKKFVSKGAGGKILKSGKNIIKSGSPYFAADMIASQIGKEGTLTHEAADMAGTLGAPALGKMTSNIYSKVKKMGTKKALEKIIKKGGWKLAAKVAGKGALGAIGTPFSGGASAALAGGLLLKDVYDIYQILNEE